MTTALPASSELEAARVLLARLGITPELLVRTSAPAAMPTFDEYIGRVEQAVGDGTGRAYRGRWNRIRAAWGGRRLDEPTTLETKQLAERTKASAPRVDRDVVAKRMVGKSSSDARFI